MRTIKFRAYHKKEKKMYEVDGIMWGKEVTVHLKSAKGGIWATEKEIILVEFTGCESKSGKEIYEGDFLRVIPWRNGEQDITAICEVAWSEDFAKFSLYSHPIHPEFDVSDFDEENQHEIIGNKFENKELLKND